MYSFMEFSLVKLKIFRFYDTSPFFFLKNRRKFENEISLLLVHKRRSYKKGSWRFLISFISFLNFENSLRNRQDIVI